MAANQIESFNEQNLAEIAAFLRRSIAELTSSDAPGSSSGAMSSDASGGGDGCRWLLQEDSVVPASQVPPGEALRNAQGEIVGMLGYVPHYFRLGDRRLLGIGAHNFYVDPAMRMQGFFLFRRYLNHPAADFCYSTSCNDNSGPLWKKCGGMPVIDSHAEDTLICNSGPVMQEIAMRKRVPPRIAALLRLGGPVVDLFLKGRRSATKLKWEPCSDWERLAEIAERCRPSDLLTPERSARELEIRNRANVNGAASAGRASGVFRFWSPAGQEGWFSIREVTRGLTGQIRGAVLHDIVWPRDSIGFVPEILPVIAAHLRGRADILSMPGHLRLGLPQRTPGVHRRDFGVSFAFIYAPPRSGLPPVSDLAQRVDFPPAFGA